MKRFPFISLSQSLLLIRIFTAGIFIAHAVVRVAGGTVTRFGGYLENKGFPNGNAIVWGITVYEIIGGLLLAAGFFSRWLAAGFIAMLIIGIIIIHAAKGWFTGEHGSGGMEYSVMLIVSLIVIAAADKGRGSKD